MCVEHTEQHCPLRNSQYCSNCADYGHLTKRCPAKPSAQFTEPIYVEQLLPPSVMKEYGITTRTLLPASKVKEEPQRLLEIEDNDRIIATYLSVHSVKPVKGCTKRHLLEEYAKVNFMRVVYVPQAKPKGLEALKELKVPEVLKALKGSQEPKGLEALKVPEVLKGLEALKEPKVPQ